ASDLPLSHGWSLCSQLLSFLRPVLAVGESPIERLIIWPAQSAVVTADKFIWPFRAKANLPRRKS
ncbi:MAG: hypothetical protein ACK557_22475, partial [Planctomycetota bacterium]